LPTGGPFQRIDLQVSLDCPTGGCDRYDRTGSLGVVTLPAVDGGSHGSLVEIARFITPFGVAAGPWSYDVTDLAPLLAGAVTFQAFIDTWAPQGSPAANGAGWLLTATLIFTAGTPAKSPAAVLPVWTWPADSDPVPVPYGDPNKPLSSYMMPQTVMLPPGTSSVALRSFVTGHGQGNTNNCAEFCAATHTLTVNSMSFDKSFWQTCCSPDPACELEANPNPAPGVAPGQRGTYQYPRSGWCPGSAVGAWTQDVTAAVGTGLSATLTWGFDSYVNTCRDDFGAAGAGAGAEAAADVTSGEAGNANNDAGSCVCDEPVPCAFNGGGHTEPIFYITSILVAYR
jgi:hypothetical protein